MNLSNRYLSVLFPLALTMTLVAQDPGVRRAKIGTLQVTALLDGELPLGQELLKGADAMEVEKMIGAKGPVTTSVNAYLVDTGKHRILVDAGGTAAWGIGHLMERLQKAGVNPQSIDAVLITHLHGDHIGALLTADGKRAFPHAQLRLAQAEDDYWMDPATEAKLPEMHKPMLKIVKTTLAVYKSEGAYRPFAPGEAPFDEVTAIPTPGHTPGHTSYVFGTGKNAFWVIGDVIHFSKVQFAKPEVTVAFDVDTTTAAKTRLALWQRAAREKVVLAGAHLPFPGLGHIEVRSQGFVWVPLP